MLSSFKRFSSGFCNFIFTNYHLNADLLLSVNKHYLSFNFRDLLISMKKENLIFSVRIVSTRNLITYTFDSRLCE